MESSLRSSTSRKLWWALTRESFGGDAALLAGAPEISLKGDDVGEVQRPKVWAPNGGISDVFLLLTYSATTLL